MFYVTSEIYLNNDLGSLAVSVDNYPQKRKNHLTITYKHYISKFPNPLLLVALVVPELFCFIFCFDIRNGFGIIL